jgi:hypothetical protein
MAAALEAVPLVFKHQKHHKNSVAESNLGRRRALRGKISDEVTLAKTECHGFGVFLGHSSRIAAMEHTS